MPLWVAAAPPSFPTRRQPPLTNTIHNLFSRFPAPLPLFHSFSPAPRAATLCLAEGPSARATPQGPCSSSHHTQPRRGPKRTSSAPRPLLLAPPHSASPLSAPTTSPPPRA